MGPYKGVILQDSDIGPNTDCRYVWEVKQLGGASFYIDGKEEEHANWMRFVNCARDDEEQNLAAFQYKDNIYYSACQEIRPGAELLTWYGTEFATKHLGLSVDSTSDPNYLAVMACDDSIDTDKCEQQSQDVAESTNNSMSTSKDHNDRIQQQNIVQPICDDDQLDLIVISDLDDDIMMISDSDDDIVVISSDDDSLISVGDHREFMSLNTDLTASSEISSLPSSSDDSLPEVSFLKDQNYPCLQCGQSFSSQEQATAHIKLHLILCDKPFCCHYCGKLFKQKISLQQHTTSHTRPYPCQYCSRSFSSNPKVDRHMKFHGIIRKPHQCQHCSASFFYDSYLRKHVDSIHTSKKPFRCQYCDKLFTRSDMLLRHTRLHTVTDKPFHCQQCSKSFAQPGYLNKHMKVHTKPYQCQHCHRCFSQTRQLKQHMAKKHTNSTLGEP
ncbi:histone-lysine N-methyltransferase PRDM9-like isoform X2 [Dysidea avara]